MVEELFEYIVVEDNSRKPKYRQIVDSIVENIAQGRLKLGQKIPSINTLSEEFYLSRDTAEKAYNILKGQQIITSIRGKGFYIARTPLISKINILFMINKLSSHKMMIHNSFIENLGGDAHVDLHIYHCDSSLFVNLLEKNLGAYDYYAIMPHFKTNDLKHVSYTDEAIEVIKKIPKDKLVILDNNKLGLESSIEIYQDFENDIYDALHQALGKIMKYKKIILTYPEKSVYPYPRRVLHGVRKFCFEYDIDLEILDEIYDDLILKKGDLFITVTDSDLVNLIKETRKTNLKLGKDIGIISYNDTPLKELLGITVVSTDFKKMGELAAKMLLEKVKGSHQNAFNYIERNSL